MPNHNYKPSLLLNSLRKYDIPDIVIGGNEGCEHEWVSKDRWLHRGTTKSTFQNNEDRHMTNSQTTDSFCLHCNAWKGQYGLEPTFQLYIEHTMLWCMEAKRVLMDDGIMFLNLGDSYSGGGRGFGYGGKQDTNKGCENMPRSIVPEGMTQKCLLDIPFRVSIALVDNQGWIKRNNIPWYSPNKMPESVTDRFSKKHEMIFMMVKNPKYYFDLDAVREEWQEGSVARLYRGNSDQNKYALGIGFPEGVHPNTMSQPRPNRTYEYKQLTKHEQATNRQGSYQDPLHTKAYHPNGKNPGDIFIFNTQPSPEKHYAMWPESLVERMIKCSTKPGDIVCDPFAGSGTTLRVADKLNREAYGIDLGYGEIQKRRLSNIQKELI